MANEGGRRFSGRFGFISRRIQHSHSYLIKTNEGELFTFALSGAAGNRFLHFATVQFDIGDQADVFDDGFYTVAVNVREMTTAIDRAMAPAIQAFILKSDGKSGLLSFESYGTKITLPFFAKNLVDRNCPQVGSHVIINTRVINVGARVLTQTYRMRIDTKQLALSCAFVCPTHVATRLSSLVGADNFIIFFGEFERDFERRSSHPFFTTADFLECLPGGVWLPEFTFSMLTEHLRNKYIAAHTDRRELVSMGLDEGAVAAALATDQEYIRLADINRHLRRLGQPRHTALKATIILNPLPYVGDILGTASRFLWSHFATWASTACSAGDQASLIEQIIVFRPLNAWVTAKNFIKLHAQFEYKSEETALGCVLLAADPVNFGFACRISKDGTVNFRNSDGIIKIGLYIFKAPNSQRLDSWGEIKLHGVPLGAIDLADQLSAEWESGSAREVRAADPHRDIANSFVISFTKRVSSPSFDRVLIQLRKILEGYSSPWEVRPTFHEAITVTARDMEHKEQLLSLLGQGNTRGLIMCMPLNVYADVGLVANAGGAEEFNSVIVNFFAWDAQPPLLVEILGPEVRMLAIDRRSLMVFHPSGNAYITERLVAANEGVTGLKLQPLFHSLQTGPEVMIHLLTKKRRTLPSFRAPWKQLPNNGRQHGVVLTGLSFNSSEAVISLAYEYFFDETKRDFTRSFVKDRAGRIALLVEGSLDDFDIFTSALNRPIFTLDDGSTYVASVAYNPDSYVKVVPHSSGGHGEPSVLVGDVELNEREEKQLALVRDALNSLSFFEKHPPLGGIEGAAGGPCRGAPIVSPSRSNSTNSSIIPSSTSSSTSSRSSRSTDSSTTSSSSSTGSSGSATSTRSAASSTPSSAVLGGASPTSTIANRVRMDAVHPATDARALPGDLTAPIGAANAALHDIGSSEQDYEEDETFENEPTFTTPPPSGGTKKKRKIRKTQSETDKAKNARTKKGDAPSVTASPDEGRHQRAGLENGSTSVSPARQSTLHDHMKTTHRATERSESAGRDRSRDRVSGGVVSPSSSVGTKGGGRGRKGDDHLDFGGRGGKLHDRSQRSSR